MSDGIVNRPASHPWVMLHGQLLLPRCKLLLVAFITFVTLDDVPEIANSDVTKQLMSACALVQFYARGLFATWPVTRYQGASPVGFVGCMRAYAWATRTALFSVLDWPIRKLSQGRVLSTCATSI